MKDLFNKIKSDKKFLIIILALVGIITLFISYVMPKTGGKTDKTFSETDYISDLESRVESIVSKIYGVGECSVMININSTVESVYVKENKKSYDNNENTSKGETENTVLTMTDENGNQSAPVTKQIMPKICGVTVVCDGGENLTVQKDVITAVSTLLDIGSEKVCVIKKSK